MSNMGQEGGRLDFDWVWGAIGFEVVISGRGLFFFHCAPHTGDNDFFFRYD